MGTWGVNVFDDDLALEVRDGFRELIAAGWTAQEATDRLVAEYEFPEPGGSEIASQWIALAVTQWRTGRLLESVRNRALAAMASESARGWEDPRLWRKRQKVIEKTVATLNSPQPDAVKIKRAEVSQSPYQAGDVLRFTLDSGVEVGLWALNRKERKEPVDTSVENEWVLLGFGDPHLDPVREVVARGPALVTDADGIRSYFVQFGILFPQHATGPRWTILGNVLVPETHRSPTTFKGPLDLRVRPGKRAEHAQDWFQRFYEGSLREPSPQTAALLELAHALPEIKGLWDGHFETVPADGALLLMDQIAAGDNDTARIVLAIADRQLEREAPVRAVGLEIIDRLLNIASHPESGVTRQQLLPLLGPNGLALLPVIDAAWATAPATHRWELLDDSLDWRRRRAIVDSRRLTDDRYVVLGGNGYWERRVWAQSGRPGQPLKESPALTI